MLLLLFEFNKFSVLIDIIDNIIHASETCHQNSNQCSIFVMCLRLYHVTSILHCHWREFWSRDTDVHLPCIRFGIIDRFFCQFLDTRTSERCLTGLVQLLRFSGYSLHPFHFSFTVPLRVNWAFPVLESLWCVSLT